jgi:Mg/Co/Ni transporter MgtE (contains CBS domain)
MSEEEISIQDQYEEVVQTGNYVAISEFLNQQNISDVAELIEENEEREMDIFQHLSVHRAASLFKILEHSNQKRIIKNLPPAKSAELLNEMQPDDRTAFLEDLPNEVVRELVKTLTPEERKITLSLLGYPENSVGKVNDSRLHICS